MGRTKKTRTIDGKAIYLPAGLYELDEPIPCPYLPMGYWPEGTIFVVERHVDKIGDQNAYEHYSLRPAGVKKYLVKSYQHDVWNTFIERFRLAADDLNTVVSNSKIHPLFILDQLEQTGRITRDDVTQAIEERENRLK